MTSGALLLGNMSCSSTIALRPQIFPRTKPPESDVSFWEEVTQRPTLVKPGTPPEVVDRLKKELSRCHVLNVEVRTTWSANDLDFLDVFYSYATPPGSGGFESVIHYSGLFVKPVSDSWSSARQFLTPADVHPYEKPALTLVFLQNAADEVMSSGEISSPNGKRPKFQSP